MNKRIMLLIIISLIGVILFANNNRNNFLEDTWNGIFSNEWKEEFISELIPSVEEAKISMRTVNLVLEYIDPVILPGEADKAARLVFEMSQVVDRALRQGKPMPKVVKDLEKEVSLRKERVKSDKFKNVKKQKKDRERTILKDKIKKDKKDKEK